jgi:ABC-type lipoprotein export system ATPase subunit
MADVVVSLRDVEQTFRVGDEVISPLQGVNFDMHDNTFNIVYGPSGSGKSTLLNVLSGLQKPTKGTVRFDDNEVYNLRPDELAYFRANRLGFVYQTNYWIKSLSVLENVAMSLYFMGHSRSSAVKMAHESLEQINMGQYAKKYPVLLSGGEQQRIAMARALATNPKFVIADEPTGSLDSKSGDMIIDLLRACQSEHGRTVILVTHNMEYLPLADHLLHISDGHVEELDRGSIQATTDALMQDMKARIDRLANLKHHKAETNA